MLRLMLNILVICVENLSLGPEIWDLKLFFLHLRKNCRETLMHSVQYIPSYKSCIQADPVFDP